MWNPAMFLALIVMTLGGANSFASDAPDCDPARPADIAGVWRLVEATTTMPDGTVQHPYGKPAAGLFIYTPGGHLSLHLHSNPPPARFEQRPTDSELGSVARRYIGYYGKWSVNGNTVVHHIEGAMLPNRIGQDAERPFTVCGDVLELAIEADDGRRFYRRLERREAFQDMEADKENE
jgi:hypothetical protein